VEEMYEALRLCLAERAAIKARLADVIPKVKSETGGKIAAVRGEGD
jgi:hypothetical protein